MLTSCKECDGSVSNSAVTCPHCGKKLNYSARDIQIIFGGLLSFAGMALIGLIIYRAMTTTLPPGATPTLMGILFP